MSRVQQLLIDNEDDNPLTRFQRMGQQNSRPPVLTSRPTGQTPQIFRPPANNRVEKPRNTPATGQNIRAFANPLDTLTQREGSSTRNLSPMIARPPEKSDLEKLISELLAQSKSGYQFERGGPEEQMINEIFGSQLSEIANARNMTNSRFTNSLNNTRDLYQGHVNETKGKGRQEIEGIYSDARQNTNEAYDGIIANSQADQNENRAANEEMLKRLGLQASAPAVVADANQDQAHLNSLNEMKAANQGRNNAYETSSIDRNNVRAQSLADESVSQQAALERQLQDILGDLGSKEADVNSRKSQALFELMQQGKQDWRSDRDYAMGSLAELLEAQGSGEEAGGINGPVINNVLNGLGITDPALQQRYSSAYTDAVLNAPYQPGLEDQEQSYVRYLAKQFPNLDKTALQQLVSGNLNYGTYKMGAPIS